MPQRPLVRAKQKIRATRRLAKWRANKEQQQATQASQPQAAATTPSRS